MLILILFSRLDWQQLFTLFCFTLGFQFFSIQLPAHGIVRSWISLEDEGRDGISQYKSEGKQEKIFPLFHFHCAFSVITLAKSVSLFL